jgi:hypothetical protein
MKDLFRVIRVIKGFSRVLKDISKAMNPFEAEVLFLLLERDAELETLYINRSDLSKKTREQTEDMLVALTKLFYEMVYKRSPAWQRTNLKWLRKKKKWGKNFEESFKAFLEGREKTIILPPVGPRESKVYLCTGEGTTLSIFRAERELIEAFAKEAIQLIYNEFAKPLDFSVLVCSTEFLEELEYACGLALDFIRLPDGRIAIRMELI